LGGIDVRQLAAVLLAAVLALVGCTGQAGQPKSSNPQPSQQPAGGAKKQWKDPPAMQIDPQKKYTAVIKTSLGDMTFELWPDAAPKTVNNFVFLARQHFYDGVIFHRVIKDFMVQTGDPTGTGTGGPGYRFGDELPPKGSYTKGVLAMANAGPNTQGSQFFICSGPQCQGLDQIPNYTQFGKLIAGEDVLDKIASVEVGPGNSDQVPSRPKQPPVIHSIEIKEG
jgi:cyclophilin family peptidyl-prolyl cis-trans isomerase